MSLANDYQNYLKKREDSFQNPMSRIFYNQEQRYVAPFQIYGNVYYVGDSWVCAHLIDTGTGLLLIDSGNVGATAMLIQSIWELGFNPRDVKWLISSHGHIDHIGGAHFFRNLFGTKLYLGAPDADMFLNHPELSYIQDSPNIADTVFVPDVRIQDGDLLQLGNTTIECHMVPGHTRGCIALFFDARDHSETKRCGYYGGFGFNTLEIKALEEAGDPEHEMWRLYKESLNKVIHQPVDIFLGNHTDNNRLMEKRKQMEQGNGENPFLAPMEWSQYLQQKQEELEQFIQSEQRKQFE